MEIGDVSFDQKKRLARLAKMGIGPVAEPLPLRPPPSSTPRSFSERRNTGPVDLASAFEAPPPPAKANRAGLKPLGAVEPREFQSNWYPTPADTALSDDDAMEQLAKKGKAPNATVAAAQVQVKAQKTKKRKGKRSKEKDAEETEQDSQPAHGTNSEDEEKDGLGPAGAGLMSEAEVGLLKKDHIYYIISYIQYIYNIEEEFQQFHRCGYWKGSGVPMSSTPGTL